MGCWIGLGRQPPTGAALSGRLHRCDLEQFEVERAMAVPIGRRIAHLQDAEFVADLGRARRHGGFGRDHRLKGNAALGVAPFGAEIVREQLAGELAGQRSSRLSLQYRVVYSVKREVITVYVLSITPHKY